MQRVLRFTVGTFLFWALWLSKCTGVLVLWYMHYVGVIDAGMPPLFGLIQFIFILTTIAQVQKLKKLIFRQKSGTNQQSQFWSMIPRISNSVLLVVDIASFLWIFSTVSGHRPVIESKYSQESGVNSPIENYDRTQSPIDITVYDEDLIHLCEAGFKKGYDEDQVFAMAINAGHGIHSVEAVLEWYRVRRNHPPYQWNERN